MSPDQVTFVLAEYNALHKEIEALLDTQRNLPQYALLVSAAFWTWLLTSTPRESGPLSRVPRLVLWVSPIITALLAIRAGVLAYQAKLIGMYLSTIEAKLDLPLIGLGWESRLQCTTYPWFIVAGDVILWFGIVGFNSWALYYFWHHWQTLSGKNSDI